MINLLNKKVSQKGYWGTNTARLARLSDALQNAGFAGKPCCLYKHVPLHSYIQHDRSFTDTIETFTENPKQIEKSVEKGRAHTGNLWEVEGDGGKQIWKVMEQPRVGLKCLYLLLYPPNIFELAISVGLVSIFFTHSLSFNYHKMLSDSSVLDLVTGKG